MTTDQDILDFLDAPDSAEWHPTPDQEQLVFDVFRWWTNSPPNDLWHRVIWGEKLTEDELAQLLAIFEQAHKQGLPWATNEAREIWHEIVVRHPNDRY